MFNGNFLPKEAKLFKIPKINSGTARSIDAMRTKVSPNAKMYDTDTIREQARQQIKEDGNGLVGDLFGGALGFIPKKGKQWNEAFHNKTVDLKDSVQRLDNKAANKVKETLKVKEGGLLDRFTSTGKSIPVGEEIATDGTKVGLNREWRQSSLLAPVQNTTKVVSPFLATAYLADKMYPSEEQEQVASEEDSYQDKNGVTMELLTERLDKKAALEKVAQLEDEIEKLSSHVDSLKEEKNLFWKQAETERMEKERIVMEKVAFEKDMMEKISSADEFKARVTIRERSKNAVKVAEDLLDSGIIKQAEFNKKVDFLMDCDDETFNLHSSLSKHAQSDEKGLETSAFFIDYNSKDDESSPSRPTRGLSIKGQTIGEAAKDLKK